MRVCLSFLYSYLNIYIYKMHLILSERGHSVFSIYIFKNFTIHGAQLVVYNLVRIAVKSVVKLKGERAS